MSPQSRIFPAVFAGVFAALLAATGTAKRRPEAPITAAAVIAILIWITIGPAFVAELIMMFVALLDGALDRALIALGFVVLTGIVLFPWPIARTLLIPRGHVKLAWAISRLSFWVWRGDVRGGAVVVASWAALRRAQLDEQADADAQVELHGWIERRRDAPPATAVRWRTGGAALVATGLLAEARRDRASARPLLVSATELAEPTRPGRAVAIAWEWLCAEAIERGAWREVEFLARTAPVRTRTLALFGAVAARLTGIAPVPSDAALRLRWLLAPHRAALRELLERALATPSTPEARAGEGRQPSEAPELPDDQSLHAALLLHSFVLTCRELGRDELASLASAWDRALVDPALEQRLRERGLALGAHERERHPDALAELVRDDLLALVRAAGLELGSLRDDSELLARAARQLHGELLDGLEITTEALESRVEARRELPAIDEWQGFLAVREQYNAAVALGGLALRRLAFHDIHGPVCALAVWLWNERSERALANAMFHWLLAEAVTVDDAEAIRLQERNVECGV
jgi:hypothetical protein